MSTPTSPSSCNSRKNSEAPIPESETPCLKHPPIPDPQTRRPILPAARRSKWISFHHIFSAPPPPDHPRLALLAAALLLLRRQCKAYTQKRNHAATRIQTWFRSHRQRSLFLTLRHRVILVQSLVRRRLAVKTVRDWRDRAKKQAHRQRVVQEVLEIEESYTQQLNLLVNMYVKPMRALEQQHRLQGDLVLKVFANIEDIAAAHVGFSKHLKEAVDNFDERSLVAGVFLELCHFTHMYAAYCCNYDQSLAALEKCKSTSHLREALDRAHSVDCHGRQEITSMLILPVQHIPRYELLIRDLYKNTWQTHPDHSELEFALQKIKDMAKTIDRTKSFHDTKHKIPLLARRPSTHSNDDLTSHCDKFIKQGLLHYREVNGLWYHCFLRRILDCKDAREAGERLTQEEKGDLASVFLFTDCMLVTKKTQGTLQKVIKGLRGDAVWGTLNLFQAELDACSTEGRKKESNQSFVLKTIDGRHHLFTAESTTAKTKWLQDVREALETSRDDLTLATPRPSIAYSTESVYSSEADVSRNASVRKVAKMHESILKTIRVSGLKVRRSGLDLVRRVSQHSLRSLKN